MYRRVGVQEFIVWRVPDRAIDWWELREGKYAALPANEARVICSRVFPGLCLDVPAILAGDSARVVRTLHTHLTLHAEAHAELLARLASAGGSAATEG